MFIYLFTGRVVVRTIGGGFKKTCYWVDYKREGPANGGVLEERVYKIMTDPVRSAHIALVAGGDHKRWIIASENMKIGDVIKTSSEIPRIPGKNIFIIICHLQWNLSSDTVRT